MFPVEINRENSFTPSVRHASLPSLGHAPGLVFRPVTRMQGAVE